MQDRQRERSGLARAGLRASQDVAPVENDRDRLRLDRSWGCISLLRERTEDRLGEPKVCEIHETVLLVDVAHQKGHEAIRRETQPVDALQLGFSD